MDLLSDIEYLVPRWKHQAEGEERAFQAYLKQKDFGYGFFFEPGTGKSLTTINVLRRMMMHEQRFLRTMIFAPPVVLKNWKEEFKKFSKVEPRKIHVLQDAGKKRLKIFNEQAFDHTGRQMPGIFITNYEGLLMDDLFNAMLKWQPEVIVFDESHRLKNPSAKRTKRADILANPGDPKLLRKVTRPSVFILSGSPILNSPMDIFAQFLALDGGATFGENFFAFRARYFRDANAGMPSQRHFPNWQPLPRALDEIQKLIAAKSMRAKKQDCLDLPPLIKQTILVEMSVEQKRVYEDMKKNLVAYLDDEACVAQLAITKALRLMQIVSGFVRTEDENDIAFKENPKADALADLLEDLAPDHKVIVWCVFKQDYKTVREICSALKLPMVELHGDVNATKKNENIEKFEKDPKVRVLIGHPGSAGIGVNLVASSYAIYYSRTFSLEARLQSEARNYRGGSERHESITHIDLVMQGTIEELVVRRLAEKEEIGVKLLQELKHKL